MKSSLNSAAKPVSKTKGPVTQTDADPPASTPPTHEQIAALASRLYVESGCQEGRDAENWLRAEKILRQNGAGQEGAGRPQGEQAVRKSTGESRRSNP